MTPVSVQVNKINSQPILNASENTKARAVCYLGGRTKSAKKKKGMKEIIMDNKTTNGLLFT